MTRSIKTKLVLAIGVPLLATYAVMVWCEYHVGKREALSTMESRLRELVARQAAELGGELFEAEVLARSVATLVTSAPDLTEEQIRVWLQDNLRSNPEIYGTCMAFEPGAFRADRQAYAPYCCRDERGGLRCMDIAEVIPDYVALDWYRPARSRGRAFWSEPYFDEGVGERMMCTYTAPFFRDGKLRGVVTSDVLTRDLLEGVTPVAIRGAYGILTSGRGTLVSHPDPSLVMRESIFSLAAQCGADALAAAGRRMTAGETGTCRTLDPRSGLPAWMTYAPVPSAGWSLAVLIPEDEILAPIRARLNRSVGILAAGCAVLLGIVWLVSARVTRPIEQLTRAAESLAQGNLDTRVPALRGEDEIARLGRTFNAMVADLKANVEGRLREETARTRVEGELRAAREIQETLLPPALAEDGDGRFALDAVNAPARTVAGDFFDHFFVAPGRLMLVMADVSGKGVPAAIYMAVTRTRLRDFAAADRSPAQILSRLNQRLAAENKQNMFVTLFLCCYDVSSGEVIYANAGHNPPYVVRQDGRLASLEPTGPLVGPLADATFDDAHARLEPGDLLVLFTDGVTEAASPAGELFGEARLESLLESLADRPVAEVCQGVIRAIRQFSPGELADDATVLVLGRTHARTPRAQELPEGAPLLRGEG